MYGFALFLLTTLRKLGFKKAAVRLAYDMERRDNTQLLDAANIYLYTRDTGFVPCTICHLPVLSETEPAHASCREDAANYEDLEAGEDLGMVLASFCTEPNCYEDGKDEYDGKCYEHAQGDDCSRCGYPESICVCSDDDYDDDQPDECPGGCGETEQACVCSELASLRKYNATPMEERCGPWTA
jgi:hypothetical protein